MADLQKASGAETTDLQHLVTLFAEDRPPCQGQILAARREMEPLATLAGRVGPPMLCGVERDGAHAASFETRFDASGSSSELLVWRSRWEELYRYDQRQMAKNSKRLHRLARDLALARLERALERNIARDMFELHQGAVLDKVHDRNCKREPRFVLVSAEEMQLRWSKDLKHGRSFSTLDLYEVIHLHYGSMNRACVLHGDVPPWLCFSLYTARRSFDFCCPDEHTAQHFVLGLSRLCDWASGTVATRRRFMAIKGWCKLESCCFRQQTSLGQLFHVALLRLSAERSAERSQMRSSWRP